MCCTYIFLRSIKEYLYFRLYKELSTYTQNELNFFIFTLHKNGFNAATNHGYINTTHGNIITDRRVRQIVNEFGSGVRTSLERVSDSSRFQSSSSDVNVAWVKN